MENESKVPIKNIYYMLCYAWNILDQSEKVFIGSEKFNNVYNLFAQIYINGLNSLIKRGFSKYYVQEINETTTIKGKILVSESIKNASLHLGRAICQFDEFSMDIKLNQILKTTIDILISSPSLDENLRKQLIKKRLYFINIRDIELNQREFKSLRYNRHNNHYRMLVNISELLYYSLITKEDGDEYSFFSFVKNRKMEKLYEKFVLNFYKVHLSSSIYSVYSPRIKWKLNTEIDEEHLSRLPEMRTDIVIENKVNNTQIIIDTKYYAQTLVTSNWSDVAKVRTDHMYQIFAYLYNSEFTGTKRGVLLYPTVANEIDIAFPIGKKSIEAKTLNLNMEWDDIKKRLFSIVE